MGNQESMKKIVVVGSTGNGKSALCNRLVTPDDHGTTLQLFRESDDILSETKETVGHSGCWNGISIFVIDTPGMTDTDGNEARHLQTMIDYLKAQQNIHAIFIVFNTLEERMDSNIQRLMCLLASVFKSPDFWDHVALVFTKNYASINLNLDSKRQRYGQFVTRIIKATGLTVNKQPECYFVDSKDFQGAKTKQDFAFLSAWVSGLDAIGTETLQQPNERYLTADYTRMREKQAELKKKDRELKAHNDRLAKEKKQNEMYFSLRNALQSDGQMNSNEWGNTDRGNNSSCFVFQGRRVNVFEEKWINRNFAQMILTDASTGITATGTASYSNDGVNSHEVRRSAACRQYINIGFNNGWW